MSSVQEEQLEGSLRTASH
jgi:hypothetical protein